MLYDLEGLLKVIQSGLSFPRPTQKIGLYKNKEFTVLSAKHCSHCTKTKHRGKDRDKKLSYCWETVRRESMPRIAEMDVEMTT